MLNYVIPRIKDWPINLIARKRDKILQETISEAILEFNKAHPTNAQLRSQLQKHYTSKIFVSEMKLGK